MKFIPHLIRKTKIYQLFRRTNFANDLRHLLWLRKIRLNHSGKIVLPTVRYFISKGCNLKCEYCVNFNPYRQGVVQAEDLFASFRSWSEKIEPSALHLSGGEPFLHPSYEEIVQAVRLAWPNANIQIMTNGILLPQLKNNFLEKLCEHRIKIVISRHLTGLEYAKSLDHSLARLSEHLVDFDVLESCDLWNAPYQLDGKGVPRPAKSNPKKSWRYCRSKYCTNITGNRMYTCAFLPNVHQSILEGNLPNDWNQVLAHNGVSADEPVESILRYLRSGFMKECSVCLEKDSPVTSRQIPQATLHLVRKIIDDEKNAA